VKKYLISHVLILPTYLKMEQMKGGRVGLIV